MKLILDRLTISFPSFTLGPISSVHGAGVIGLVGPNGAGKTTFLSALGGVATPSRGAIYFGEDANSASPLDCRKMVSLAGLPDAWYEDLSLEQHLPLYKAACASWEAEQWKIWSERLDVPFRKKIKTFSAGMRTRAALAISLARRTPFIALDEPWNTLDPSGRRELTELLKNVAATLGHDTTIIVSSHELDRLEEVAEHLLFLNQGNLVFDGTWPEARRLLDLGKHASTEALYERMLLNQ